MKGFSRFCSLLTVILLITTQLFASLAFTPSSENQVCDVGKYFVATNEVKMPLPVVPAFKPSGGEQLYSYAAMLNSYADVSIQAPVYQLYQSKLKNYYLGYMVNQLITKPTGLPASFDRRTYEQVTRYIS